MNFLILSFNDPLLLLYAGHHDGNQTGIVYRSKFKTLPFLGIGKCFVISLEGVCGQFR